MSEWQVETVHLGEVSKHPNADNLSVANVFGYPVIFRTGDFSPGDLVVYVPEDSVVPDTQQFHFLAPKDTSVGSVPLKHRRIKARRLRGIYSQGILVPALPGMEEGQLVDQVIGVTKYEPPEEGTHSARGEVEKGPEGWTFHRYTDMFSLRRYQNVLMQGEEVVLTEKTHGQNARFCWDGERLWCGSKKEVKKEDETVNWWHVAKKLHLAERFAMFPKTIFYGEIYGKGVQKLTYGKSEKELIIFDTFDLTTGTYNDWDKTVAIVQQVGLSTVPVVYRGDWCGFDAHKNLAEGMSLIDPSQIREGFVVKPTKERWDGHIGRVMFKLVSETYLLSK